jgi:glutathione peroxidase
MSLSCITYTHLFLSYKNKIKMKNIITSLLLLSNVLIASAQSVYDSKINTIDGVSIDFNDFKGKYILFVNVASKCGFTKQYAQLEELYQAYKNDLVVIGLPCNQFGGQEPGDAQEIKSFCTENFGVSFIITEKINTKGPELHPIYAWLTDKKLNGKINSTVKWNFQKYLLNKEGKLIDYFNSTTSPMSSKITKQLI